MILFMQKCAAAEFKCFQSKYDLLKDKNKPLFCVSRKLWMNENETVWVISAERQNTMKAGEKYELIYSYS